MTIHIILVLVFLMHISVRMTIHILIGFRHAHLCTKNYPFLCGSVFFIHISLRMTIHILFVLVFVLHIYVRFTIHILIGFRQAHLCTNDYEFFLFGFPSCTFLYELRPLIFLYWFSSCTNLN